MKFFNTLAGFANIDQETYRCELIVMTHPGSSLPDLDCRPLGKEATRPPRGGEQEGALLAYSDLPLNASRVDVLASGRELKSWLQLWEVGRVLERKVGNLYDGYLARKELKGLGDSGLCLA